LGIIHKDNNKYANKYTDQINMIPYGTDKLQNGIVSENDFIPFKFKDVVNGT